MARRTRPDWDGALHHVMARGIGGESILSREPEREDVLRRLSELVPALRFRVFAWVLMPNHLHLLLQTGPQPLSLFMQSLLGGFAVAYNRRRERTGHVFQGRFKSLLVEYEPYFRKLVRYIHLNPLKAGLVGSMDGLRDYPWSGHRALHGLADQPWMDSETTLREFGGGRRGAGIYQLEMSSDLAGELDDRFLEHGNLSIGPAGLEPVDREDDSRSWSGSSRVLGSRAFGLEVLRRIRSDGALQVRDRGAVHGELDVLFRRIERRLGISLPEIRGKGRSPELQDVRVAVAWKASTCLGCTVTEIARLLNCSRTSATNYLKLSEEVISQRPMIRDIITL